MTLSNTAIPKYYGQFRDRVMAGEIPVNHEIEMEMNRIDDLINNPGIIMTPTRSKVGSSFARTNLP